MRVHQRLQDHLHDRLRHAVGDRRNAEGARAAVVLRYLDEPHRRREVGARRHPIPDLVEVVLQVRLERRQRLAIHARSATVRFTRWYASQTSCFGITYGFASGTGSSHRWLTAALGRIVGPLRSARVTRLRRYYEPVRPCASHRYSAPRGASTWSSPFASRRQVPTFRTRACAGLTPPSCRSPLEPSAGIRSSFVPGQQLEPGFDDVPTLSTRHQRFTRVRLPSAHLTGCSRLFRNAHHPGHWTDAASGGLDPDPATRVRGADPHLSCSMAAGDRPYITASFPRRRGARCGSEPCERRVARDRRENTSQGRMPARSRTWPGRSPSSRRRVFPRRRAVRRAACLPLPITEVDKTTEPTSMTS